MIDTINDLEKAVFNKETVYRVTITRRLDEEIRALLQTPSLNCKAVDVCRHNRAKQLMSQVDRKRIRLEVMGE